ncbi:MAG: cytidylate kinase family protein [Pyrinomonadaceae bacterium]
MKLSIAGDLGSGKSSVAKILAQELGFTYLSTGQMHRNIAEEYGVNSLELNRLATDDESIDDRIDSHLISLNESDDNLVIDSRMAWHFVKDTFKIYLEVHSEVGADRVLGDSGRLSEPIYQDRESALLILKARKNSETERFFDKYNVRCDDLSNYDIVINTSDASIESASKLILRLFEAWRKQESYRKFWISPSFVFPTKHVGLVAGEQAERIKAEIGESGFKSQHPIECVKYNEYYFIRDGHKRCSGALYNKLEFIPFNIIATDDQEIDKGQTAAEFARSAFNLSWYYDWEEAHEFRFIKYPRLPHMEK